MPHLSLDELVERRTTRRQRADRMYRRITGLFFLLLLVGSFGLFEYLLGVILPWL
jgi:hypothetical protein